MCGEQSLTTGDTNIKSGSSPRVRGAGTVNDALVAQPGIIPACAGSRLEELKAKPADGDHPRVCGEQT